MLNLSYLNWISIMYKNFTIIGVGALGGFLCKYLCESNFIHNMTIIDYDVIENKNICKSIYKPSYIGEYKVDALQDMMEYTNVPIKIINEKYQEGITKIPKSDLIIDCRDVVINRISEINLRLYLNGYDVVFDCRKYVNNLYNHEGCYLIDLPKEKIKHAAYIALEVIENNSIENMITNNLIKKISLNLINKTIKESIIKSKNNREDIIYETTNNNRRILCVEEILKPILKLNTKQDVNICVKNGVLKNEVIEIPTIKEKTYLLAKRDQLIDYSDLIKKMEDIVALQPTQENYIATIEKEENGQECIELVMETGAA